MNRLGTWLVVATLALLAGCRFDGIQNMSLPGTVGTGEDALIVTAELPDVGTLTPNAQVRVDEVVVGTVTRITVEDWHAVATLSLEPDVDIPVNARARVGVNSLLGAAYVELSAPRKPKGTLSTGDVIPLARGHAYATTEQVLSTASLALNGGGLEQIATITHELNRALGGDDRALASLLPRLDTFLTTLNGQRREITATMADLDRLAARYAGGRDDIVAAVDQIGPALGVLAESRPDLTAALDSLRELGTVATPLVRKAKGDLVANLRDLRPLLQALHRSGPALVTSLGYALSFPFDSATVGNACRGAYCNINVTLDLTAESLSSGFLEADGSPSGLPNVLGLPVNDLVEALTGPTRPLATIAPKPGEARQPGDAPTLLDLLGGGN